MSRRRRSVVWLMSEGEFKELVANSFCYSDIVRAFNFGKVGGNIKTIKSRIADLGLDISHFGNPAVIANSYRVLSEKAAIDKWFIKTPHKIFCNRSIKCYIKKFNLLKYECSTNGCGVNTTWLGSELILQLDHIDGDRSNNVLGNLRYLCPNCHSQTPTYAGRSLKIRHECTSCGGVKQTKNSENCASCAAMINSRMKFDPTFDELHRQVCIDKIPFTALGKEYGVSDNAVRKRCIKLGIDPKTRSTN